MWGKCLSPQVSVLIPEGGAWEELGWISLHLGSHLVLTPWTLLCAAFPPLLYAHCLPVAHFSSCSSCLWLCRLSSGILSTLPCVLPVVLRSIVMWNGTVCMLWMGWSVWKDVASVLAEPIGSKNVPVLREKQVLPETAFSLLYGTL